MDKPFPKVGQYWRIIFPKWVAPTEVVKIIGVTHSSVQYEPIGREWSPKVDEIHISWFTQSAITNWIETEYLPHYETKLWKILNE